MAKGIVIAGTHSGCGKTTVTLALMAALRRKGLVVQPFKVGPDFIDPGHHALAAGRQSHNLDGWMCGRRAVQDVFARHAWDADIAVAEGVMGLYDGFSPTSEQGSTAEVAKWLKLPVLLVVDARSMARSAAALVKGFAEFDPFLNLAGVAFNRAGSENHAKILAEAMALAPNVPLAGVLRRREGLAKPSRHLGLVTACEAPLSPATLEKMADWIEQGLDLDRLVANLPHLAIYPPDDPDLPEPRAAIGVAWDKAFCFYYDENLRLLRESGARLIYFSPMEDQALPQGLHGLYLGGGYPEVHARALAQNRSMRRDIRDFCRSGRPVLAECGGFMYLMDALVAEHGQNFPMAGIFPFTASMNDRFAALGYREVTLGRDCPLGPAGLKVRGHEFHYSSIPDEDYAGAGLYIASDRHGSLARPEGFTAGNVVASYIHLHFGSNPSLAQHFVGACAGAVPASR
jgi:cobyrinic acid a,c-diamide synthase